MLNVQLDLCLQNIPRAQKCKNKSVQYASVTPVFIKFSINFDNDSMMAFKC